MKVTFVKPNIGRREHSLYVDEARMEPLMLGVLAGMTPPDVEVAMYDDRMESVPYDEDTDLVAITVETYTARRAYEIAAEFRQRGVPVIMGGMHATLLPEETSQHADSIFLGDAERAAAGREDAPGYAAENLRQPTRCGTVGWNLPRRDVFKGKGYLPIARCSTRAAAALPASSAPSANISTEALHSPHRRGAAGDRIARTQVRVFVTTTSPRTGKR